MWTILDNYLGDIAKVFLTLHVFLLFLPSYAATDSCAPFEIYPNFSNHISKQQLFDATQAQNLSKQEWIKKISLVPGHLSFPALYKNKAKSLQIENETNYLACLFHYITQDFDKDGSFDWQVSSENQFFDKPVPLDLDWDNDGITNLFDAKPFFHASTKSPQDWRHLHLTYSPDQTLNHIQSRIYKKCGVLAINHTDQHSISVLKAFEKICEKFLSQIKRKPLTFVLYSFAGHSLFKDIKASFYPELNYMSIGGSLSLKSQVSEEKLLRTLSHEVGHYLIFNHLKPQELLDVAALNSSWATPLTSPVSFFNPLLLSQKASGKTGYFPTTYSTTNIHEWLSEVFAVYLTNFISRDTADKKPIPANIENWLKAKFPLD